MWWFRRTEEAPPGLPDPTYALFKTKEGWHFLRSLPGVAKKQYREGPFPEKEDARWYAWADAWERGLKRKEGGTSS